MPGLWRSRKLTLGRFLRDLSALIRERTYRDDAPDSEQRVINNLNNVRSYLNARIETFNDGQRALKIVPFQWQAEIDGVTRWVFGFRLGDGPRKFSMFTHLDTVPPEDDFDPPINYHGENEGAPIDDLRLSAKILWRLLLRQVGDAAGSER